MSRVGTKTENDQRLEIWQEFHDIAACSCYLRIEAAIGSVDLDMRPTFVKALQLRHSHFQLQNHCSLSTQLINRHLQTTLHIGISHRHQFLKLSSPRSQHVHILPFRCLGATLGRRLLFGSTNRQTACRLEQLIFPFNHDSTECNRFGPATGHCPACAHSCVY